MSTAVFDAIVVGARCAGSPVAMLLARSGASVLLVDRDEFPSDTISTHLIHPPGVAHLRRWGLLERLVATGCPPIEKYTFDLGQFSLSGQPEPIDGHAVAYAPRRTILDKLLLDSAAEAGVEVREGFAVTELLWDDGVVSGVRGHSRSGAPVEARARVVVGADGRYSTVVKAVQPRQYNDRAPIQSSYYTYWQDLPVDGFAICSRPPRGWGAIPTHDGLTLLVIGWPIAEFEANKRDVEAAYLKSLDLVPEFADRVRRATRQAPYRGAAVPGYFRQPYGPGWALVGDAGYNKDPITAFGITDAFRDAELCAAGLIEWLQGRRGFDESLNAYHLQRDAHTLAMYELTCGFATLQPAPPETQQLLGAASATPWAQTQFVSMMAGTLPVPSFFAPENVQRIIAGAAAPR